MLRINEKKYYSKKSSFKTLYKKLGLQWQENTKVGDVWTNNDFSKYLRKLPEREGMKKFYAHNCPEMVEFLKGIGAVEIADEPFEPVSVKEVEKVKHGNYPGHKEFKERLDNMPDNFIVKWGDELSRSSMDNDFKKRWAELQMKYYNYTFDDLLREMEEKNKKRRKEQGIEEDPHENDEVIIKKRKDNDILPVKEPNKRAKRKEKIGVIEKHVKIIDSSVKPVEFKKKVFKIRKK